MDVIQHQLAVVTGAAGGMGSAIARTFANQGWSLILSDLHEAPLAALATQLRASVPVTIVPGDVTRPDYGYLLAADVPESVLALMIATQRPVDLAALNEKLTSAAWTNKPSWQIWPLQDPVFPVEEWKFQSDRAHAHVIEVNSSHGVPVTYPDVVVDVIGQAARAVVA